MKKILLSLGVIAIVAVGAIGATRAYFSSTATMSGNTFTAGTMALKIDQNVSGGTQNWVNGFDVTSDDFKNANGWNSTNNGWNLFMAQSGLSNLYPGVTNQQIMDIKNDGTVDGIATIKFDATAWNPAAIGDNLNFTVYYDAFNTGTYGPAIASGTLAAWNHNTYNLGVLTHGAIASVKIVWSIPTTAGNDIMGATATVNTVFGLNQAVPTRVTSSSTLNFDSTGWAGWSCPAGKTAVGGGVLGATQTITGQGLAIPGANIDGSIYPIFPHYTYSASTGETGYVVHNGSVGQSVQVYVDCL